ncbi:MAG: 30S ribosomal protein S6 [Candidatus Berkelbacteria bacterium]|nr:30S ribosomal protein S6 [Candidatus Berkelbacteria bacterium]
MDEKQASSYELTFIVLENESDKEILEALQKANAKVTKNIDLGVKGLAFPIKKQKIGHYFSIKFDIAPSNFPDLEKSLKLIKPLIRYLIITALRFNAAKPVGNIRPAKSTEETAKEPKTQEEKQKITPEPAVKVPILEPEIIKPVVEEPKEESVKIEKIETEDKQPENQKTSKPAPTSKTVGVPTESVGTTKKPAATKPVKAVKIEASELNKTLEELVKE